MADVEDDTLDLTAEDEVLEVTDDEITDDDEIVLDGEDEFEPEADDENPTVKKVRDWGKEQARKASEETRKRVELERKLAERDAPVQSPVIVGDKPTLESCDYDDDRFDREYDAWKERDRQATEQRNSQATAEQEQARRIQSLEVTYRTSAAKVVNQPAFEKADATVRATLGDQAPLGLTHIFADETPRIIMALAKYPKYMDAVQAEPDMNKRILIIERMRAKMTTASKRTAPPPERDTILRGSASTQSSDKVLQGLEAKAAKTGDRSEVIAYKAKKAAT